MPETKHNLTVSQEESITLLGVSAYYLTLSLFLYLALHQARSLDLQVLYVLTWFCVLASHSHHDHHQPPPPGRGPLEPPPLSLV
jgi:hypothetical protein